MEMALLAKVTRTTRHKGGFAPPARSTSRWASASGAIEANSAAAAAPTHPHRSRLIADPSPWNR